MNQAIKFNVLRRLSIPEQEYNEEKITIIMKFIIIKLFMFHMFATFFCRPLNKQSKKIIFLEMTEITRDKKIKINYLTSTVYSS